MSSCNHDCGSCHEDCGEREAIQKAPQNEKSNIKKVIGVVSGKGGVGKSLVTSLLAAGTRATGKNTAIMDADITGPSIPKMFGVHEAATSDGTNMYPEESEGGTKIISINMMLENETDPVIWRGPVIAGVVKQFWTDCAWGDVDVMFVDMPPGTGDVPLTVFQSLPVDGIIVVASPQELVEMIVAKAVKMAQMMEVPVLGLVENMSYFVCSDCGKKHAIFGESHLDELAVRYGIDCTAQIPINPELAQLCDAGKIEWVKENPLKDMLQRLL